MALVGEKTAQKYPRAVEKSVGSFLILRMFGPYIVKASRGSQRLQRQLILIVKILTNLANNTYFKEGHLVVLNPFLKDNMQKLSKLLNILATRPYSNNHVNSTVYSPISAESLPTLYPHFQLNADRIRNKLIEIHLKQGGTSDTLREKTGHMRRLLCQLGEPQAVDKSSLSDGTQDRSMIMTNFHPSLPELHQVFRQIGLCHDRKPIYYLELAKLTTMPASAVINMCGGIRQIMLEMTGGSSKVLLDVTGFSLHRIHENFELQKSFSSALLMHDLMMYVYNANKAFMSYVSRNFGDVWTQRAAHTQFLDHTDTLEFHFDPAVCLHLASTHGLLVKTYPHDLSFQEEASGNQETSVRLVLHSDDTLLLSMVDKLEVTPSKRCRIVEQIVVKNVRDIHVDGDVLVIVMLPEQTIRLRTNDPRRELQVLQAFMGEALQQFKTEVNDNVELIEAHLLCVGLVKLSSADPVSRDSGAQILLNVLPDDGLQPLGILSRTASCSTSFHSSELRSLHQLSRQDVPIVSRLFFLDELLHRLPYLSTIERRSTLPCLEIWLADVSTMVETSPAQADTIKRILLALLNLHSPLEDSELSLRLWTSLAKQDTIKDLLYEHLSTYACLYQYNARQVQKVSQVFRILNMRGDHYVKRLANDLVSQINAKVHKPHDDMNRLDNWTSIQVLLRLMVDITARNLHVIQCVPEIMYIIMSLHNMGSQGK